MARVFKSTNPRDKEIYEAHRKYIEAMEARLETITDDTKEGYLKVLMSLTGKLNVPGKPLSEIVTEMMAEAAPLLFQAMQR
jgi:hypothetical protein